MNIPPLSDQNKAEKIPSAYPAWDAFFEGFKIPVSEVDRKNMIQGVLHHLSQDMQRCMARLLKAYKDMKD